MTNYEKLTKTMDRGTLAEWLNRAVEYCHSPWDRWFDKNYCQKCPDIMGWHEKYHKEIPLCWCEVHDTCKFFPEIDYQLNDPDIIKMWLDAEADEDGNN